MKYFLRRSFWWVSPHVCIPEMTSTSSESSSVFESSQDDRSTSAPPATTTTADSNKNQQTQLIPENEQPTIEEVLVLIDECTNIVKGKEKNYLIKSEKAKMCFTLKHAKGVIKYLTSELQKAGLVGSEEMMAPGVPLINSRATTSTAQVSLSNSEWPDLNGNHLNERSVLFSGVQDTIATTRRVLQQKSIDEYMNKSKEQPDSCANASEQDSVVDQDSPQAETAADNVDDNTEKGFKKFKRNKKKAEQTKLAHTIRKPYKPRPELVVVEGKGSSIRTRAELETVLDPINTGIRVDGVFKGKDGRVLLMIKDEDERKRAQKLINENANGALKARDPAPHFTALTAKIYLKNGPLNLEQDRLILGLNRLNDGLNLNKNKCRLINKKENRTNGRCNYTLLVSEDTRIRFGDTVQLGLHRCRVDDPLKPPSCYACRGKDHLIKNCPKHSAKKRQENQNQKPNATKRSTNSNKNAESRPIGTEPATSTLNNAEPII